MFGFVRGVRGRAVVVVLVKDFYTMGARMNRTCDLRFRKPTRMR